ncbi:MAG: TIGR03808 family TAT-translocated repetitive protein [Alphaproteobacteria bacterium]|nr:TIGR03808 family TAT-translocated repetitive protein [Alphaproteobacteria bacterium]
MDIERRHLFALTAGLGLAGAASQSDAAAKRTAPEEMVVFISPSAEADATGRLQSAFDRAARLAKPVRLAAGHYPVRGDLRLPAALKLDGQDGLATIDLIGQGAIIADGAGAITVRGLTVDGTASQRPSEHDALMALTACRDLSLSDLYLRMAPANALKLWQCSGTVSHCRFEHIAHTAINSGNADGLSITANRIDHAGNNGIVVWRDTQGADATAITLNRISHIRSDAGGSGQNGNAINAFRSGHVLISSNIIAHCAYSAVRCNAASNAQIIANNCRHLGEVALYAEFGFEGAIIANNIVDHAATGIEVTNFDHGGRLATVQGNVIRNLVRREHEPVDKRGIGIGVEADTVVNGNTIENAATSGIAIGWGRFMRHVAVQGNLVRDAEAGITISVHGRDAPAAGILIASNIVTGSRSGAIRLSDHGTLVDPPLANGDGDDKSAAALVYGNLLS